MVSRTMKNWQTLRSYFNSLNVSTEKCIRSSGVRGGGEAAPSAWKIQGKLCFQGKLNLLKNPER